jgi:hypothetical protein
MCGRSYDPRFLFTWPIGRCSVMGPDQLSGVMGTIAREAAARYLPPAPPPPKQELMIVMGKSWMRRLWQRGQTYSGRVSNMILLHIILLRIFWMMGLLIREIQGMCLECVLKLCPQVRRLWGTRDLEESVECKLEHFERNSELRSHIQILRL